MARKGHHTPCAVLWLRFAYTLCITNSNTVSIALENKIHIYIDHSKQLKHVIGREIHAKCMSHLSNICGLKVSTQPILISQCSLTRATTVHIRVTFVRG